ncbi:hypothetical protein [Fructobacillus evanidus]|uniref:Uncharacterized protein n=1 Tax=Fructobacillus evanidus TaxID=3064281 RepID=A0ABM9MTU2_9LACO|nr:unnamed protein product [Fructobacillus sp. LMG 32999]CAK1239117.1 unnamed protein product [Fructobacillus sp. LMG 32999]CAK1239675.1 unnamed protein product [Fructobacillus sp. LMG 32999]CAK1244836.1 unnamed protein product [Fructobacillus sp. LMG 32999]CAK1245019.1 unnamed protein product [Fructobacillus sp. LMG 32999]
MLHLRDIWKTKPFWIFIVLMTLIVLGGNTAIASAGPNPLQQQQQAPTKIAQPSTPITKNNAKHILTKQANVKNNHAE